MSVLMIETRLPPSIRMASLGSSRETGLVSAVAAGAIRGAVNRPRSSQRLLHTYISRVTDRLHAIRGLAQRVGWASVEWFFNTSRWWRLRQMRLAPHMVMDHQETARVVTSHAYEVSGPCGRSVQSRRHFQCLAWGAAGAACAVREQDLAVHGCGGWEELEMASVCFLEL